MNGLISLLMPDARKGDLEAIAIIVSLQTTIQQNENEISRIKADSAALQALQRLPPPAYGGLTPPR
jgi:hypothetical protein